MPDVSRHRLFTKCAIDEEKDMRLQRPFALRNRGFGDFAAPLLHVARKLGLQNTAMVAPLPM
jgi:hypothetical protein